MNSSMLHYTHGIHAVDAGYERPLFDSIHLIVEAGRAAVVDTGTNYSVDATIAGLQSLGVSPEQVDYVVLTHVHLDHAGGAGELMRRCPNAKLAVHPRGARHMIDPSRLWEATVAVYGAAQAVAVYGSIVPIPPERVIEMQDGAEIVLAGRKLLFRDTPGHAKHHNVMIDSRTGHAFVGDILGFSYRELDHAGKVFILPTSSPTQFDPAAMHRSLDLVASYQPEAVYLTHYSQVRDIPSLVADLHRMVDLYAALGGKHQYDGAHRFDNLHAGMRQIAVDAAARQGLPYSPARIFEILGLDLRLNAQGLESWLDAQR
ncbi:MAG: MBL fold metallo-hydrolase [Betaproteobacteria bacterium]|nr:MBL fold metallo-hydrolase [Betaproteobacteria bacterium]